MRISPISAVLAVITFVVHLIVAKNYEPHRDELLYLVLGQHMDWGYASVPPFIGFLGKLAHTFFSDAVFGAKFFAALFCSLTTILVGATAQLFSNNKWVIGLACVAHVMSPVYVITGALFQPVVFDVFFWTLSGYFFIKMVKNNDPSVWLPLGASWALGFMNKYNIAFMILACVVALLLTEKRKLFLNKQFIYAIVLGFVIISPNLYWQYQHFFPVFHHMKELSDSQLVHVQIGDFFKSQILMNIHAVWLWVFALWAIVFYKKEHFLKPVLWMFVVAMALFVLGHAKSYYTIGLYPMLFAVGGYMVEQYWSLNVRRAALVLLVILPLPILPIGLPIFPHAEMAAYFKKLKPIIGDGFLKWETGEEHEITQDYSDMIGWQEMTDMVKKAYDSLSDEEKKYTFVYGENYGQAGAIAVLGEKMGLPYPISFSDNFLYWIPENLDFKNLVLLRINDEEGDISQIFDKIEVGGEVKNPYAREKGAKVWICRQPKPVFETFYKEKLKSIKEARRGL